jgi:hypothetical protein
MLVHDHGTSDREALPGASADVLGREERVEDAGSGMLGNATACILDRDDHVVARPEGLDADTALRGGFLVQVGDGVAGIDDDVEDRLVELADKATNGGKLAEAGLELGDVLPLVACDRERALDRLVEVGGCQFQESG